MAKWIVLDLLAVALIWVFVIGIYMSAPLRQSLLDTLCIPENFIEKGSACQSGLLLLYMIPLFSASWLILRLFTRISRIAASADFRKDLKSLKERLGIS